MIDINAKDMGIVKSILKRFVPDLDVKAFGSRVTRTAGESSDLDLVIMTQRPLPTLTMADLKEAFSESDLPFKVDVVDWASTGEAFRRIIQEHAVSV